MSPIKVFEVVECGGPGGTGEQVAAICNGLDPARFEVSLVYAARDGKPDAYRSKCAGAKNAFHIPEFTREISPARDARALRRLYALFREHKPDVVHAHSSKAGALARPAALAAGVKKIFYSPHAYGFLMTDRSRFSRALYMAVERAIGRIGETIAVAPSEAGFARDIVHSRSVHTVCDAYLGNFAEKHPHEGMIVGSCGRITYARNPEAWTLLTQRLTDSRNGVKHVWIGGGEDEGRMKKNLTDMNLTGRVEITGWLTADQARERLLGLDVLVHYSRWDGLPNSVLDAMAAGVPVVASDIPGNQDAVVDGETGFLVKSESQLLERCQQLLDDAPLRLRLGAAGRERVRREFSRERMLAELSRLYSAGGGPAA